MIDKQTQLQLQAYVDGELSRLAAWRMQHRLASDPEARTFVAKLETLKQITVHNEPHHTVPETHQVYWTRIAQLIQQHQPQQADQIKPMQLLFLPRRILMPAVATVCTVLLVGLAIIHLVTKHTCPIGKHEVVVAVADPGAITYRDHATGVTLVWFSYPAQN